MFLKVWAANLTPMPLLQLGDLLAELGFKNEAKQTFEVVLLVPGYAEKLWGKDNRKLTHDIVSEAKASLKELNT
jgi:hypothetical protein